jgi:hypothetical protein
VGAACEAVFACTAAALTTLGDTDGGESSDGAATRDAAGVVAETAGVGEVAGRWRTRIAFGSETGEVIPSLESAASVRDEALEGL